MVYAICAVGHVVGLLPPFLHTVLQSWRYRKPGDEATKTQGDKHPIQTLACVPHHAFQRLCCAASAVSVLASPTQQLSPCNRTQTGCDSLYSLSNSSKATSSLHSTLEAPPKHPQEVVATVLDSWTGNIGMGQESTV